MTQILQKHPSSLTIRAGSLAKQLIENEGLYAHQVDTIPGAAGGPKGIGIHGLDQAIFAEFLPKSPQKRTLIGSSIGSWRFASIMANGAKQGSDLLAELYTNLEFDKKMTREQVAEICRNMLKNLIINKERHIIEHPDYHLSVLAVKSEHIFQSDQTFALLASIIGIVSSNAVARQNMKYFMQRVIAQPQTEHAFKIADDGFKTLYCDLNAENIEDWLVASASIPVTTAAVKNIAHAPQGVYRDGGLIDYHIDLPFQSKGIVLYPHFTDSITPGWFDKMFKSRKASPENQARTLLISPSQDYLNSLPLCRLPDRKDFTIKGMSQQKRIQLWKQCIAESQRMGDEFLELVEKQRFAEVMQTL